MSKIPFHQPKNLEEPEQDLFTDIMQQFSMREQNQKSQQAKLIKIDQKQIYQKLQSQNFDLKQMLKQKNEQVAFLSIKSIQVGKQYMKLIYESKKNEQLFTTAANKIEQYRTKTKKYKNKAQKLQNENLLLKNKIEQLQFLQIKLKLLKDSIEEKADEILKLIEEGNVQNIKQVVQKMKGIISEN